jgi:hypothetical protein
MKLARGQIWSVLVNSGPGERARPRIEVRVVRLFGRTKVLVETADGTRLTWRRLVLERGLRGAHLVEQGHSYRAMTLLKERITSVRCMTQEEQRTASDLRKPERPRGLSKCSDADRAVAAMAEGGMTRAAIAAAKGLSKTQVASAIRRVADADYDARALKAMGQ